MYSNPEFVWEKPVCPTGIAFSTSEKFAQTNRIFVGDCINGNIYRLELNEDRTGFVFDSPSLQDNTLNIDESNEEILFGTNFGAITDVEEGPDGFLYIVSLSNGKIYRIIPKEFVPVSESVDNSSEFSEIIVYLGIISIILISVIYFVIRKILRTKLKPKDNSM